MEKLSVRDLEVKGRRVLVRVDFNVPTEGVKRRSQSQRAGCTRIKRRTLTSFARSRLD